MTVPTQKGMLLQMQAWQAWLSKNPLIEFCQCQKVPARIEDKAWSSDPIRIKYNISEKTLILFPY